MLKKRPGFSLIDLIVVMAMMFFLIGLLLPAVQQAKQSAERKKAINNLKQILLATHSYHDSFKILPAATNRTGIFGNVDKSMQPTLSMNLLPFVEQLPLAQKILADGKVVTDVRIEVFNDLEDSSTKDFIRVQNFASNVRVFTDDGMNTKWDKTVTLKGGWTPCGSNLGRSFPNGTSNTIGFATRYAAKGEVSKDGGSKTPCGYYDLPLANDGGAFFGATPMAASPATATSASGWQVAPTLAEVNCGFTVGMAHSFDKEGILVGLMDASVRTVAPAISTNTWNNALQGNSGNKLGKDW